jgi:hypothetical protein
LEYKIEQKDQLVAKLKETGLGVLIEFDKQEEEYLIRVFDNGSYVGSFEPGNESWELVCYSIEAEKIAKKYGLMDLIKNYWAWY